jgi:quercetin dioxygenase-like cupin family protein
MLRRARTVQYAAAWGYNVVEAEVKEPIEGDGYAVASIDGIGEGYGFRKIRRALGVTAFGINAVAMPAGYESGRHFHDEQEEVYFVHRGRLEFEFGDGSKHVLGEGGIARVDAATVRKIKNVGETDAVYVVAGGKDGYVGRDGRVPDDETSPRGPGFSGPAGAASS